MITSSGGSGHLQAAKAKNREILLQYPEAKIITIDLLVDWLGKRLGGSFAKMWNNAQSSGNVAALNFYSTAQPAADAFFFLPIFIHAIYTLLKEDIDQVIDTQPMGTKALLKAVRFVNYYKKKHIKVKKIVTDLPSNEAFHFFLPIRHLSKKDKQVLQLFTTTPLLTNPNQTPDQFWKTNCNLSENEVFYNQLPIRSSFNQFEKSHPLKNSPLILNIFSNNSKDTHLIHRALSFGSAKAARKKNAITYSIDPKDKVAILMLGTYPHKKTALSYIKGFIKIFQENNYLNRKDHLFVLCSHKKTTKTSLQEDINRLLEKTSNYPKNLTIVPLPYQDDQIIASLLHRSDATFTRSGGLTSMELLTVCHGQIYIHKNPHQIPKIYRFIKRNNAPQGMPPWEIGNARYLQAKKGAKFTSPDTLKDSCRSYFCSE